MPEPSKLHIGNRDLPKMAGSPIAVQMMDMGFLCHIMEHISEMADGYDKRGEHKIAQKLSEVVLRMVAANNVIAEQLKR